MNFNEKNFTSSFNNDRINKRESGGKSYNPRIVSPFLSAEKAMAGVSKRLAEEKNKAYTVAQNVAKNVWGEKEGKNATQRSKTNKVTFESPMKKDASFKVEKLPFSTPVPKEQQHFSSIPENIGYAASKNYGTKKEKDNFVAVPGMDEITAKNDSVRYFRGSSEQIAGGNRNPSDVMRMGNEDKVYKVAKAGYSSSGGRFNVLNGVYSVQENLIETSRKNNISNENKEFNPSAESEKRAEKVIKNNKQNILDAAHEYNVNPGILASAIYTEQANNVSWKDYYIDPLAAFALDVSLGVSQVRISTAMMLEDRGYMKKTEYKEWHGNNDINSRRSAIAKKLQDDKTNIRYAAAYMKCIIDIWKSVYPEIDNQAAIMATLYNMGEYGGEKGVHSYPTSSPFGNYAGKNYNKMLELLDVNNI